MFDSQESTVTFDHSEKHPKKRVCFSDSSDIQNYSPIDVPNLDDTNIIQFKHSENKPCNLSTNSHEIHSPSDIYRNFLQNYFPKPILRNKIEDSDENFDHSRKDVSNTHGGEEETAASQPEDLPIENVRLFFN